MKKILGDVTLPVGTLITALGVSIDNAIIVVLGMLILGIFADKVLKNEK